MWSRHEKWSLAVVSLSLPGTTIAKHRTQWPRNNCLYRISLLSNGQTCHMKATARRVCRARRNWSEWYAGGEIDSGVGPSPPATCIVHDGNNTCGAHVVRRWKHVPDSRVTSLLWWLLVMAALGTWLLGRSHCVLTKSKLVPPWNLKISSKWTRAKKSTGMEGGRVIKKDWISQSFSTKSKCQFSSGSVLFSSARLSGYDVDDDILSVTWKPNSCRCFSSARKTFVSKPAVASERTPQQTGFVSARFPLATGTPLWKAETKWMKYLNESDSFASLQKRVACKFSLKCCKAMHVIWNDN